MSEFRHRALVDSLRRTVERLTWEPTTTWSSYGPYTSYGPEAAEAKKHVVREMLELFKGDWVWDLGANTGDFSALAAETGRQVVAIDADHGAAELHYRQLRQSGKIDITSVVGDIGAPTPAVGWNLTERPSLFDRANADVVLALALVHHLAIGGNVPLTKVASVLERLAPHAIVEFVPKEDPQLERMLAAREDVFPDFSLAGFRAALREHFRVVVERPLPDTNRVLFALERHPAM